MVAGVRFGLGGDVRPRVYVPGRQLPFVAASRYVVVTTRRQEPETLVPTIRELVREIDPGQPITGARTLAEWRSTSVAPERFQTVLLLLFGGLALLLGAVGVYGVVSYSVGQRTREVGIRMALGAREQTVLWWVLRGAMTPVTIGLGLGLIVAATLSQVVGDLLHKVSATDPVTFLVVPLILVVVAVGASLAPAVRATRVDPVASLRRG